MVLLLSAQQVERLLTMDDAIEAVEGAFKELASHTARMPPRQTITLPEIGGWVAVMPALLRGAKALATKVVTVFVQNPAKAGLPTTMATLILNDPETGKPLAFMDAGYITAARTGAVGGVAAKYLARKDAGTLGVFGSGMQARMQVEAVARVRGIKCVRVYSKTHGNAVRFSYDMSRRLGVEVTPVDEPRLAVAGSGIVATATTSPTPVLKGEWLEPGVHVNCVGAHTPDARELDSYAVKRAKVVVDSKEAALREAGELVIPIKEGAIDETHIYAELGELVTGAETGRADDDEITVFKSCGLAIQDAAAAFRVYSKALRAGVGEEFKLN